MSERTLQDLQMKQALPLSVKILLTKERIRQWVNEFGEDGVYVSFSGGKDSTVLLHLVREDYPDIPAVFCDTGLEYPEIREFVKTFDNVTWLKPKMNFKAVIEKYGYPFISKEVSERVAYAQKFLTWYKEQNSLDQPTNQPTNQPSLFGIMDICGVERGSKEWKEGKKGIIPSKVLEELAKTDLKGAYKIKELFNPMKMADGRDTQYDYRKWKWLVTCPMRISNKCCDVMKKSPIKSYEKQTGKKPMLATMASESRLRTRNWILYGCNAFENKRQESNPMSFWTEQDVLLYIYEHGEEMVAKKLQMSKENNPTLDLEAEAENSPEWERAICSVYGEIIKDNEVDGQQDWADLGLFDVGVPVLRTTGCNRTGCMFCGFGCHLEKKGEGRFELMKETHPKQYEWIMKPWDQGGLGYKDVIDWINEHGGLNIRY